MTSARKAVATMLIGAACATGMAACGGDDKKIGDKSFLTDCTKKLNENAQVKAYGAEICKCVQDDLKDKGYGDKGVNDKKATEEAKTSSAECTREALTS